MRVPRLAALKAMVDKAAAEQLAHAQKALREGLVIPGIAEGRQALAWHGVANDLIIMGACACMGKVHAMLALSLKMPCKALRACMRGRMRSSVCIAYADRA